MTPKQRVKELLLSPVEPDVRSIAALERRLSISNGTINKWDRVAPSAAYAQSVASYFGVPLDYLLSNNQILTKYMGGNIKASGSFIATGHLWRTVEFSLSRYTEIPNPDKIYEIEPSDILKVRIIQHIQPHDDNLPEDETVIFEKEYSWSQFKKIFSENTEATQPGYVGGVSDRKSLAVHSELEEVNKSITKQINERKQKYSPDKKIDLREVADNERYDMVSAGGQPITDEDWALLKVILSKYPRHED